MYIYNLNYFYTYEVYVYVHVTAVFIHSVQFMYTLHQRNQHNYIAWYRITTLMNAYSYALWMYLKFCCVCNCYTVHSEFFISIGWHGLPISIQCHGPLALVMPVQTPFAQKVIHQEFEVRRKKHPRIIFWKSDLYLGGVVKTRVFFLSSGLS